MVDLSKVLGPDTFNSLLDGLARRKYHLLLGAGASMGGASRGGAPLPTSKELAAELAANFFPGENEVPELPRAYKSAVRLSGDTGRDVAKYMKERFSETTPPPWYKLLLQIGWKQIWSLNIDDCLSRAGDKYKEFAIQRIRHISWTDTHRNPSESKSEILAIYLHGKATNAAKKNELIFDIRSYVRTTTQADRWHKVFTDDFVGNPFIIVGASLSGEFDLNAVLEAGNLQSDHPSIIILPTISNLQKAEYEDYGLIPVECSAEDFFSSIMEHLPQVLQDLTPGDYEESSEVPPEASEFYSQWDPLRKGALPKADPRHDIFKGHEPNWSDAVKGRLVSRDVIPDIVSLIDDGNTNNGNYINIISGEVFSGKTAALYGIARQLVEAGYEVYEFNSETAPDLRILTWWLQRYPKAVLIIDNAADYVKHIESFYTNSRGTIVLPHVLAVDRRNKMRHFRNVLDKASYKETFVKPTLSNTEIKGLLKILRKERRLGQLTDKSEMEQFRFFKKEHGRSIFSAMAGLERGREFNFRILDLYDEVVKGEPSGHSEKILRVVSISSSLGYGIPAGIACAATGLSSREITAVIESDAGGLVLLREGKIHLRHRYMGELLLKERVSKNEFFGMSNALARALSPHVTLDSLVNSTLSYNLARSLMTRKYIAEGLEGDHEFILRWYESLQDEFSWNARFWEQRALSAADFNLFEPAYSWAREAVRIHRDSLTLNTVGTILMRRASLEIASSFGESWPMDTYDEAVGFLREARAMRESNEYPYQTFFNYTIKLIEKTPDPSIEVIRFIDTLWREWYAYITAESTELRDRLFREIRPLNEKFDAWKNGL